MSIINCIKAGVFEDVERELEIAVFHINNSSEPDVEEEKIIKNLKHGIPIVHQIGYTVIKGRKLQINNNVLNPGPETIMLCDEIIKYINKSKAYTVLDMCTGIGVFAILTASYCNCSVTAIDISEPALKTAQSNAYLNNCTIEFILSDLFDKIENSGRTFDVIVSNPPYVKSDDIINLPDYITNYTPKIAIDGGIDGLNIQRKILAGSKKYLSKNGRLFIECEEGQDTDLMEIAFKFGWEVVESYYNKKNIRRGFQFKIN